MNKQIVKVFKGRETTLPVYSTAGSAGCDVKSADDIVIEVGKTKMVQTGIYLQIPEGYEIQVRPRSGLAIKHGIIVTNSPGTIDSKLLS